MTDLEVPGWIKEAQDRAAEPLDPELEPWLYDSGLIGTCLKHPLVFSVPYWPQFAWRANDQLRQKKAALVNAEAEGEWDTYLWLHERPFRVDAMREIAHRLASPEYWKLLGMIYTDTENFWQNRAKWDELLRSRRQHRECFMLPEEQEHLAGLPDELTVYRGFNGNGTARSWAWTLDRKYAEWFARRLLPHPGAGPTVVTGTVRKSDVIGYLSRRGEEEIAVSPAKVTILDREVIGNEDEET